MNTREGIIGESVAAGVRDGGLGLQIVVEIELVRWMMTAYEVT